MVSEPSWREIYKKTKIPFELWMRVCVAKNKSKDSESQVWDTRWVWSLVWEGKFEISTKSHIRKLDKEYLIYKEIFNSN